MPLPTGFFGEGQGLTPEAGALSHLLFVQACKPHTPCSANCQTGPVHTYLVHALVPVQQLRGYLALLPANGRPVCFSHGIIQPSRPPSVPGLKLGGLCRLQNPMSLFRRVSAARRACRVPREVSAASQALKALGF